MKTTATTEPKWTPEPWAVEYDNDTGSNDDCFHEFWRVASGKFTKESDANRAAACVNACASAANPEQDVAELRSLLADIHDALDTGYIAQHSDRAERNRGKLLKRAKEILAL